MAPRTMKSNRRTPQSDIALGFPIGDPAPLKVFANAKLSDAQKEMILSSNAQRVFRVRSDAWVRAA